MLGKVFERFNKENKIVQFIKVYQALRGGKLNLINHLYEEIKSIKIYLVAHLWI